MKIDETDQWLLDGICEKCRRKPHCTKRCRANKVGEEKAVKQAFAQSPVGQTIMDLMSLVGGDKYV